MKNSMLFAFSFLLFTFLTGCCSWCQVDREIPKGAIVEGEKPIATFYVQNTSYQILGFIPWTTGVNWTEEDEGLSIDNVNRVRFHFFYDGVSLDNNIRTLKCACKELGSNRIASLTHTVNEDNLWSIFLMNRKTLKTSCFILEPKKN